ncbi:MAG: FHA domain-containing protein [Chloroflexi bacterium]|nr:MAG: FHA domain-containing protein [Chloroflexota bacterium]
MSAEQDFPVLVAQNGPLKGERWPLDHSLVLGRDAGCDVTITDRQVSRFHARLTPGSNGVVLEDLGSKNGTNYGNNRISAPVVL